MFFALVISNPIDMILYRVSTVRTSYFVAHKD